MVQGGPDAALPGPVERSRADHRENSRTRSRKSSSLANPWRTAKPPNQYQRRSGKGNRGAAGKNPRVNKSQKPRRGEEDRQAAPVDTERREGSEASKTMERRGGEG